MRPTTEHGKRNTDNGTQNTENGTQTTEHGKRNTENGTQNTDHGTPTTSSKSLLRFLTCGSVDDGKSTLIGENDQILHTDTESYLGFERYREGHQPFYFIFSNCQDKMS